MELVRIEVQEHSRQPPREPERSSERPLCERAVRLHRATVAQTHRHVRVLAENDDVLDHERQQHGQAGGAEKDGRTECDDDGGVGHRQSRRLDGHRAGRDRLRAEQPEQPDEVPEVGHPIEQREDRDPEAPADVDDEPFDTTQWAWHERGRGRVEILPPGPLVVTRVDRLPAAKRDQREEPGERSDEIVQPAGAEERAVPALVQEREPLQEGHGQDRLPRCPEHDRGAGREPPPDGGRRRGPAEERTAHRIGGAQRQARRRRCLVNPVSHDFTIESGRIACPDRTVKLG